MPSKSTWLSSHRITKRNRFGVSASSPWKSESSAGCWTQPVRDPALSGLAVPVSITGTFERSPQILSGRPGAVVERDGSESEAHLVLPEATQRQVREIASAIAWLEKNGINVEPVEINVIES